MKKTFPAALLPWLVLGAGGVLLTLQSILIFFCPDEKGLLSGRHPLYLLAWVLALAAAVGTAIVVWKLDGANRYNDNFPPSIPGCAGAFCAAVGILIAGIQGLGQTTDILSLLWVIFAFLSVPSLCFAGVCRFQGRRPAFFFYAVVCLFFALHLVCRCRTWSSDPMLVHYGFPLFACICLMLSAYHQAAFDAGIGRRRFQLFFGLMAVLFCCASIPTGQGILYLACGGWAFTNLCALTPPQRRHRPKAENAGEEA